MTLVHQFTLFNKSTHYYLANLAPGTPTYDPTSFESAKFWINYPGTFLQLVHYHGTETQADFKYLGIIYIF